MSDFDIERIPVKQKPIDTQIKELAIKLTDAENVLEGREKMIANLQAQLEEAGKVCTRLNSENVSLHEEKGKMVNKQFHNDYLIENQKKVIENLKKTMERYEEENKVFRALVRLWV